MAYNYSDLSVLAYANGFTLWHYTTRDTLADVRAPQYFNKAADMLRAGDMIIANAEVDTIPAASILTVRSNTNGAVTLVNLA